jgi:hypothetical protein
MTTFAPGGRAVQAAASVTHLNQPQSANEQPVSPAGCTIKFVDNPHFAASVPGAVKVNARAECNSPVPEHDLSVTLLDADTQTPLKQTVVKANNRTFVENKSTWIMCKNQTDTHRFQGAAMGTSFEDNKPYVQYKFGSIVTLKCGY